MIYGLKTHAFIEQGPVEQIANVSTKRTTARSWHALNATCRLALVDQALRAANDQIDEFANAL